MASELEPQSELGQLLAEYETIAKQMIELLARGDELARCLTAGIRRRLSRPQCATRRPVARRLDQNSLFKIRRRS